MDKRCSGANKLDCVQQSALNKKTDWFPPRQDSEQCAERYSRMPPLWAMLDHTLGVVWNLGSKPGAGKSGIADLQWALEFLGGLQGKEGASDQCVQGIVDAIGDHLIARYAAMGDADGEEPGDDRMMQQLCDDAEEAAREVSVTYSEMLSRLPSNTQVRGRQPDLPRCRKAETPSPIQSHPDDGFIAISAVEKFLEEIAAQLKSCSNTNQRTVDGIDRFRSKLRAPPPGTRPDSSSTPAATQPETPTALPPESPRLPQASSTPRSRQPAAQRARTPRRGPPVPPKPVRRRLEEPSNPARTGREGLESEELAMPLRLESEEPARPARETVTDWLDGALSRPS
ncbi:uncharacterized protein LOC134540977 isoform X3 [Bacillus rossius redtenbacheri]|uniref:uncharacterized protein LOC134540977 isoform X3 n=1 Tax=Bacillus rossius redtenbacheri TaxID=93214 RepID=UPI002FDED9A5